MSMRAVGSIILFLASAIWVVPIAMAQTGEREPPCMECHKPSDVAIDPAQFAQSVHRHLGLRRLPHERGQQVSSHRRPR